MSDVTTPDTRLRDGMTVLRKSDLARGTVDTVLLRPPEPGRERKGGREVARVRLDSGEVDERASIEFDEQLDGGVRLCQIPKFSAWANYAVDVALGEIDDLLGRWGRDREVVLIPDYQRGHVWDDARRSAYVEYLLRGGRERRDILFNSPGFERGEANPLELVDGLQRLTSIQRFMAGELPVFGQTFGQFHREDQRYIRRSSSLHIRFHVNDLPDRAAVLKWYLDLNTGGVVHSDAEIARVRALLAAEIASTSADQA